MTEKQEKQVIRVCGENYKPNQIPALWRKQEKEPDHDELNHEAKIRSLLELEDIN